MLVKYGLLIGLGLLGLLAGSAYITLILLITGLDIAASMILVVGYAITRKYMPFLIWAVYSWQLPMLV